LQQASRRRRGEAGANNQREDEKRSHLCGDLLCLRWNVRHHEVADFPLCLRPEPAALAQLAHEMTITHSLVAKARCSHAMRLQEGLNVAKDLCHTADSMCDFSPRQGVKFPIYPSDAFLCDTSHMNERDEVERIKGRLRQLMAQKNIKAKPLSKKAGRGETFVRDMLDGDDVKLGNLHRLAGALDVTLADIVGAGSLRVAGRIGAGGHVLHEAVDGGPVPRPVGIAGDLEALEVDGSSMLPRYSSGDIVYIEKADRGVQEEDIGDFCAVRLTTGETYIKQIAYGSRPGFWTLRSLNAEDIVDVEIEWAQPVIFVLPRAARRRLGY
jgi:DNA-binding Xre family transcriptional regulator